MLYGDKRGEPEHRSRMRQITSFKDWKYEPNITPTDMDGLIEYHGKCYVIMEFKHRDKDIPYGQKLAYKRMTDDLEKSGKPTLFLICKHDVDDCNNDIIAKDCIVKTAYYKGRVLKHRKITAKEIVDLFIRFIDRI